MKKNIILWMAASAVVMLAFPWLAVTFVKGDAGMVLSVKLDAPAPCRLVASDLDFACRASADCLPQHLQVI